MRRRTRRLASWSSLWFLLLGLLPVSSVFAEESQPKKKADNPFAGLPPMRATGKEVFFNFRPGPKPPGTIDTRTSIPFPPPAPPKKSGDVARPKAKPLRVLRIQPSGKPRLVGSVSVTFNQPMIPLTSLKDIKKIPIPFSISPLPPGRFRWLGVNTVTFVPKDRMPFSTEYKVVVPKGIKSGSGSVLEKEVVHTFVTPRPQVIRSLPYAHSPTHLSPTVAFAFNQKINPTRVASFFSIMGPKGLEPVRVVPQSEWEKSKRYQSFRYWGPKDRIVVFELKRKLEKNSQYAVTFRAGLVGEEGPLPMAKNWGTRFRTYGPLKVKSAKCSNRQRYALFFSRCRPEGSIWIALTNSVPSTPDNEKQVEVSPKKGLRVHLSGSYIYIQGEEGILPPTSTIKVTLKKGLTDTYKQTLGSDYSVSFDTTEARPYLQLPHADIAALEAKGPQSISMRIRNIPSYQVRVVRVSLGRIKYWREHKSRVTYKKYRDLDPLEGERVIFDKTFEVDPGNGKEIRKDIDLGSFVKGKQGWYFMVISAPKLAQANRWSSQHRAMLVQITDVGLTARYGPDKIVLMATGVQSGKPLKNVAVRISSYENGKTLWKGKTNAQGVVVAPGSRALKPAPRTAFVVTAGYKKDSAFLLLEGGGSGATGYVSGYRRWSAFAPKSKEMLFFFSDRDPHKPGETVHLRGVLRMFDTTTLGGVRKWAKGKKVRYEIRSPRWKILKKGDLKVTADGSFSLSFPTREDFDLGRYSLRVWAGSRSYYHYFQVQAYRAPEYKVGVSTGKGPFFLGDKVAAVIEGRYLFGAPMMDGKVSWILRRQAGSFTPPSQPSGFRFGVSSYNYGGWRGHYGYRGRGYGRYYRHHSGAGQRIASGSGKLDKKGNHELLLELKKGTLKGVGTFTLEASVYDKNRQSISSRKQIIAHRSAYYLGLHPKKTLIRAGKKLEVESILVGIDGKRINGYAYSIEAFHFKSVRTVVKSGKTKAFRYESKRVVVASCAMKSSAGIQSCSLKFKKAGSYTIEGKAKDPQGRETISQTSVYVFGPGYVPWPNKKPGRIELITDKKSYSPGQVARILIKSPFRRSRGLLTVERNGIAEHRILELKGSAHSITLPIRSEYLPNVHVSVALVRGRVKVPKGQDEDDKGRPASAFGTASLKVSLTQKQLRVAIKAQPNPIRPSGELELQVSIKDYKGRGAASAITVALVDEGVLSLLGFATPNPLNFFYTQQPSATVMQDLRMQLLRRLKKKKRTASKTRDVVVKKSKIMLRQSNRYDDSSKDREAPTDAPASPRPTRAAYAFSSAKSAGKRSRSPRAEVAEEAAAMPGAGSTGRAARPIAIRSNFATTAYYKASMITDRYGNAKIKIKMPDNLTTFRVMVVALDLEEADRFGNGEAQVTVRKPLLLRPAMPRFANYGDRFEASVVVNNDTGKDGDVQVISRAVNLNYVGPQRKTVFVKAGDAKEVRFLVKVAKTGIARIQFAAALADERDAVEVKIPILVPATAEAFATYGTTNGSVAQKIKPPSDALSQFGGLKVSVSSTALTGLEDAVRYLINYPFGCNEQTASRVMPIFALDKILPAFKIGKISDEAKMKALAKGAINKLLRSQRYDGGWGFWGGSTRSSMWLTGYVTYALLRGKAAGYKISAQTLARAKSFLEYKFRSRNWSYRWEEKSYATHALAQLVLSEMGSFPKAAIEEVYKHEDELPLFAKAWMVRVFHRMDPQESRVEALLTKIRNRADETASAIRFAEAQTESLRLLMHSDDRTNAIVLQALLEVRPKDSMIPKIVRGLIQSRIRGRWSSTQSNAYAMLALSRYYDVYEKVTPDFTLQSWLGSGYLGQYAFKGRSMTIQEQQVPMNFLLKQGNKELVLAKKGKGRLYYRLGLRYAPRSFKLPAEEQGFFVTRSYEPVGAPDTVKKDEKGRWIFKAGTYIRVRLRVVATGNRFYTAVVDPLPAGLEAVNLSFKTSASTALANAKDDRFYDSRSWYSFFAFSHQEKRDSMVVLFADRLPAGVYEYTYIARATTIGSFVVPPTRAEEMYHPETFGRTATMFARVIEAQGK
ncbi:MAG: hypothetical protein H6727_12480 [Myxococcales bacterium]|nr:hypothetical protein [Myxococcales bacterium]